jgi:hypothetical protein
MLYAGDERAHQTLSVQPVESGRTYRVNSDSGNAPVTRQLAEELAHTLERFAVEAGFTASAPVEIEFGRGVVGHHQTGRATDIYAVGGASLDKWKKRWDERARSAASIPEQRALARRESVSNLGWRLYKALQLYGRWAQPYGYPIQLFGPWTREEGPWKHISDRLLAAHRDHIHVAK